MIPEQFHADEARNISVVTKAVSRAADTLHVNARTLAVVLGLSEASVSRMKRGEFMLPRTSKAFELALLFVRLFRSLDAITGGDEQVARAWLVSRNTTLGALPLDKIKSVSGLIDVIAYLDARRALV